MPKLTRLEVLLSSPQVVYYPGQVIQGIRMKCRGRGHVYWTEGSGDNKRTYSSSEDYIDVSVVLFGKGPNESGEVILSAGKYSYPFQFTLPPTAPGSFEGKSGCYVRYWLKGTIDRPWKFDPEYKMLFSVGALLDLNTVPNASAPVQCSDSKTVCCCCCETPPITATFRINKMGFVPGEGIVCNAEINEGTNRGVHSSKIKLIMKVTYKTHNGHKTSQSQVCGQIQHGAISPGGIDVWNGEYIVVPPLPPSYLPGCSLINIDYYVQLSIDVLDTPLDLTLKCDVIIGTIPLMSVVQQYLPQYQPGVVTNQPLGFNLPTNVNMPPPSYQECVFGKVDTTEDDDKQAWGNMSFAPSYTYYDWMNHPVPSAPTNTGNVD